ncbi:MAG: hypothetical protein KC615_13915 [Anaerolineae bacterium]|nr:hypothetical protein [Anaerolineae bacterium]
MAIDLYWDNDERTVLLAEIGKDWNWDELHAVLKTIKRMSNERQQTFGAIVDVRNGFHIPGGVLLSKESLNQFTRLTQIGAMGKGPAVFVGVSDVFQKVADAIRLVDRKLVEDVYFAKDMNDARQFVYGRMADYAQPVSA